MVINLICSKESDKICTMLTNSHSIEIMMGNEIDEIIEESLLQKYQEELEKRLRESQFVFYIVDLLHHNLQKISLNRDGS